MVFLWLFLFLLIAFLAVVVTRAARFTPTESAVEAGEEIPVDEGRLVSHLQAMLRLKTVSHHDGALTDPAPFQAFRELLKQFYPLVFSRCQYELAGKNGILLRLPGKSREKPSVLMAHYDVVPAEEALWARPPFSGDLIDGEVWGRGAIDTKCTLLSILEAAEDLLSRGFVPENDLYFSFGGDEEVMGQDASAIVDLLESRGVRPAFVLDEGGAVVNQVFPGVTKSAALIGIAEKGSAFFDVKASGKSGHASAPPAKQAVSVLAKALLSLSRHPAPFTFTKPALDLFDTLGRHSSFIYKIIFANLWCFRPVLDLICKKSGGELNALVRSTDALTRLSASESYNVLPNEATAGLNVRLIPGDSIAKTEQRLSKTINDKAVSLQFVRGSEPSAVSPTEGEAWDRLNQAILQTYPGVIVSPYLMIAASDSRHFCRISDHVYRFSGFPLTAEQRKMIHSQDERIPRSLLPQGYRFFYRVLNQC